MIRAIIVEDSRLARLELKELLKDFPQITVIAEADSAEQALLLIPAENPDLLFMDIHLPGKNGFEILQELDKVPAVIFTTAFDQYVMQSFDYNTLDYLLKPIAPERLKKAVLKAEQQITFPVAAAVIKKKLTITERIFVKDGKKCWFVTLSEVSLFQSMGNYTQVHFNNNAPRILKSLQHVEDMLDEQQFIRVNRQQIINVKYITEVAEWFEGRLKLTLTTGESIEVSRRQVNRIKECFSF